MEERGVSTDLMSQQIVQEIVKSTVAYAKHKSPHAPTADSGNPWENVAPDSENYMVICDYLSRDFEVECLQATSTGAATHKMKSVPKEVISDNGS